MMLIIVASETANHQSTYNLFSKGLLCLNLLFDIYATTSLRLMTGVGGESVVRFCLGVDV